MADTLADRIRATLDGLDIGDSPAGPCDALEAVLDLHQPLEPGQDCVCDVSWPCPTITLVAEALGIKGEP